MHTFTHMLASVLVLIGLAGKALAQSTFDANGDGTADSVAFIGDTIEVRSGVDTSLLYSIAGTSGEGFGASYLLNRDLNGDGTLDFAVAAPNAQGPDGAVGRVLAYSGATGTALWSASPAAQASLGSTLIAVADQDYDGVPDLIVSAGSPPVRSALVSGATGALVRSSDHTPAAIDALVSAGVRVFAASDLDGSGTVDAADALLFATAYSAADLDADLNGDGLLDAADVGMLANELATGVTTIDAFTADPNFGQPQPTSGGTPPAGCGCEGESSWETIQEGSNTPPTFYDCVESGPYFDWVHPMALWGQPGDSMTIGVVHPRPGCVLLTEESCAEVLAGPAGANASASVSTDGITFGTDTNGGYAVRVRIVYQCGDAICATCRTFRFGVNEVPPTPPTDYCSPRVCIDGPGIQYEVEECGEPSPERRWVPFGDTIWVTAVVQTANGLLAEDAGVIWTWGARSGCEDLIVETDEFVLGNGVFVIRITTPPSPPASCDHPHEFWVAAEARKDGCPNPAFAGCVIRLGADRDGDGLVDEAEEDMQDGGNCPDPNVADSDNDGFGDGTEVRLRSDPCDPESVPNITGDTDNDGVTDFEEVEFYRTNPLHADSDDDGADDYGEIRVARALPELGMDPNQPLSVTRAAGVSNLADGAVAAYVAHDADRDGIFDELEIKRGWLATNPDQDFDGIRDGLELRRGMDPEQADQGPASPAPWIDSDGDGLTDAVESRLGTSRFSSDSDGDGVTDGWEAALGYDPTRADSDRNGTPDGDEDFDGDGISNRDELAAGTHLAVADSDGDGLCDSRDKNPTGMLTLRWPDFDGDGAPDCEERYSYLVSVDCSTPAGRAWAEVKGQRVTSAGCPGPLRTVSVPIGYGEVFQVRYGWDSTQGANFGVGLQHSGTCSGMELELLASSFTCNPAGSSCVHSSTYRLRDLEATPGSPPGSTLEFDLRSAIDSDGDGVLDTWDGTPTDGSFNPSTIQPSVDFDIDGDNNDGLDEPEGTTDEEQIEDATDHPGKIVLADTWDSDGDTIPDFADGLDALGDSSDADDHRGGVKFVPLRVRVRGDFASDPDATVEFDYSFSDPALVASVSTVEGGGTWTLAPGVFRVWVPQRTIVAPPRDDREFASASALFPSSLAEPCSQDGTEPMTVARPGTPLRLADLGVGPYGGEFVVFLEAVRESTQVGDSIRAILHTSGGSAEDAVRATAVSRQVRPINPDGSLADPVAHVPASSPIPEVTLVADAFNVRAATPSSGRLLVDVSLVGMLTDAASDLVAGGLGTISSLDVLVNGDHVFTDQAGEVVPLKINLLPELVSKAVGPGENASDLVRRLHPYRFEATFAETITVPVDPGWNTVELVAVNLHGIRGHSTFRFLVSAEPPADLYAELTVEFGAGTAGPPLVGNPVPAFLRTGSSYNSLGADVPHVLISDGEHLIVSEHLNVAMYSFGDFDPSTVDTFEALVEGSALDGGSCVVTFEETAPASGSFVASFVIDAEGWTSFAGYALATPPEHQSVETLPSADYFKPFVVTMRGPRRVFAPPEGAPEHSFIRNIQFGPTTYWVLAGPTDESILARGELAATRREAVFLAVPQFRQPEGSNPRAFAGSPTRPEAPTLDSPGGTIDFIEGFGSGMWDAGVAVKDDAVDVANLAWKLGRDYNIFSVQFRLISGHGFLTAEDQASVQAASEALSKAAGFARRLYDDRELFYSAMVLREPDAFLRMLDEYGLYFEIAAEVQTAIEEELRGLGPRQYGWLVGRITGEVAITVAPALVTGGGSVLARTGATGAKIAASVEKFRNVASVSGMLKAGGVTGDTAALAGRIAARLEEPMQRVGRLLTTRMCFVAGTLVWTPTGLVPIECIVVGDTVWAQHEDTGRVDARTVAATIVTHPDQLWELDVADAQGGISTLTGTAEHPIWTHELGFVELGSLMEGQQLLSLDGTSVWVREVRRSRGPPPAGGRTTFNFEVEGAHTYFVGNHGVLVHNTGNKCQQFMRIMGRFADRFPVTVHGRRDNLKGFIEADRARLVAAERKWRQNPDNAGRVVPPGEMPWDTLTVPDRRSFVLGMSEEIMREAVDQQTGDVEWRKMFSYADYKLDPIPEPGQLPDPDKLSFQTRLGGVSDKWGLGEANGMDLHIHHAVPKVEVLDRLRNLGFTQLPEPELYDTFTPAVPMPRNRHTWHKDGLPTFHSILKQKLKAIPEGATNEAALVRKALKDTYDDMDQLYGADDAIDYNRIGAAMDKFLADHGVPRE